ncbi:Stress responsive A/B Barrel Domain [Caloramator fervidus]|uniref:Stress responsive A/B Barrel Domain n=1 Tax=Caloramator fervidus TaxID=29344 RepID=A0A1H5WZZ9_9CLOT|nr:Dabb family protein [Caloramator fervidus]SEG04690.1 Stress responsive A/B Barrel Domain [Caloramator fervidus]
MIKHIVMWKLKDYAEGRSKKENAIFMKNILEQLKEKIDVIKSLEVGLNFAESDAAFDIVLYSEFETKQDLMAYINHPEHQKVVEFINKVKDLRYFVDYEV